MPSTDNNFNQAADLIKASQRILLVSHRRPDGDTLGASSALYLALSTMNKAVVSACIDEIPRRLRFIPATDRYVHEFNMFDFDLIIISDAGAYHMTGFHERYPDFLSKKVPILNMDHHASNEGFGTVNIVDATASSATMIVWRLLKFMGIKITREIALALLAGIYNDTGGMMHSNTTKETFEIAADLAAAGVKMNEIVGPLFKQSTFSQLKLWGHILENLRRNEQNVVSSVVTESDLKILNAHGSDTGGIVDLMNTIPDASFTMLLAEDEGWVKGSLRTQHNDVNVSDIAGQFGGGGHKKAAGFRVQGHLKKQTMWKIVPAVDASPQK
ncbi:MAG: Phosphoesterase RecJ domain protein [Candidatus Peregrinibacteria bacterium GW2011_GWA2_47_7]|nr:MAG: Phosphoesterase RecJ domain protein [Candidatus Peregrinibacteria bacterium GW2011_GWA2_47_7]